MRTNNEPAATGLRYEAPRATSVGAAIFLALLSATLLVVAVVGLLRVLEVFGPIEQSHGGQFMGIIGALLLGIVNSFVLFWSAGRITANLYARFHADELGIYIRNGNGNVLIAWEAIQAIRLHVVVVRLPGRSSLLTPRSLSRHATTKLEFTFRDAETVEYDDPMLVKLRPRYPVPGFTHAIPVITGLLAPSFDPGDYAPALQSVLRVFAGPAFVGVEYQDETGFL